MAETSGSAKSGASSKTAAKASDSKAEDTKGAADATDPSDETDEAPTQARTETVPSNDIDPKTYETDEWRETHGPDPREQNTGDY